MSRNGSGTYSVPNTFVAGETITASGHNENWSDISAEITNSVAADGQTSVTGPIKFANGSAAAPSLTFTSSTNRGFFKSANGIGVAIGGVQVAEIGAVSPFMPVGAVIDYLSSAFVPPGWLQCYGQSLLRATYPDLFTLIGTFYGAADGTHFSLPDCRGVVIAGKSDMGTVDRGNLSGAGTLGATLGGQTVTVTQGNLPSYSLPNTLGWSQSTGTSNRTGLDPVGHETTISAAGAVVVPTNAAYASQTITVTGTITGGVTSGGSGTALSIVQPTLVLIKLIYTGVA